MEIIRKSREDLTKADLYKMITDKGIKKMSDAKGQNLDIIDYVIYEDLNRSTGEVMQILSVKTPSDAYATNSPTFIESFEKIIECFDTDFKTIGILEQKSRAGRAYLQCTYIA